LYGDIGGAWELKHSSHNYVILVLERLVSVSCVLIYYYLHVTFCCVPTMCNSVPGWRGCKEEFQSGWIFTCESDDVSMVSREMPHGSHVVLNHSCILMSDEVYNFKQSSCTDAHPYLYNAIL